MLRNHNSRRAIIQRTMFAVSLFGRIAIIVKKACCGTECSKAKAKARRRLNGAVQGPSALDIARIATLKASRET